MKILRSHKGFTTNSSSASEWVDPGMPPPAIPPLEVFDANGNLIEGADATPQKDLPTTSTSASATQSTTPPSPLADNAIMLVGFVLTILGLFALERFIRSMLKKKSEDDL